MADPAPSAANDPSSPSPSDASTTEELFVDADQGLDVASSGASTPPAAGLPPVTSPPYWQAHARTTSNASVASYNRPPPIRLEDHTAPESNSGDAANGTIDASSGAGLTSPPVRSPLWARIVRIDSHTLVAGTVRGVGDYVVWTCIVDTLDGTTIVLRKRYSEFVALRSQLETTFPRASAALPNLPPKSVLRRFQPGFLEKRRAGLEFFLK